MSILVTGAAGFIGFHVAKALLARGDNVIGVDNLNDYYVQALKTARLAQLQETKSFEFHKLDIADNGALTAALANKPITSVIHLAAQAGVRYSLENPLAYERSNLAGHLNILELARRIKPKHLVYASSSSIYGSNTDIPFSEDQKTDAPVSLYGATKKANELMSSAYGRLYALPQTGLRFFTVYGPWGRPDMAYWIFTEKMLKGEPIRVFNHGNMGRDFTYIDDIVAGVLAAHDRPPGPDFTFHRVYNLGNDTPEKLTTLISLLEKEFGVSAQKQMEEMQAGDVEQTWADISRARAELGYAPKISLEEGLSRFAAWRRGLKAAF